MSNIIFGDAESLYENLMKFTVLSAKKVRYNDNEYTVHHTQFGTYDLQNAFKVVAENTDKDPRYDAEFKKEAISALEKTTEMLDFDVQNHFLKREYIDNSDFRNAASKYYQRQMSTGSVESLIVADPKASTREEAIAEVFTLMHAHHAGQDSLLPFFSSVSRSNESDEYPDENIDVDEAAFTLRDTVQRSHGSSSLKRPDPSIHTIRAIYNLYEEFGMKIKVREVYGLFVSPMKAESYQPLDAESQEIQTRLGGVLMGGRDSIRKWINPNEPPLETLESYNN